MLYSNDLKEIIDLINTLDTKEGKYDPCHCISRMTKKVEDEFLTARAECIAESVKNDQSFSDAMHRLAMYCNSEVDNCDNCIVKKYCNSYISEVQTAVEEKCPKIVDLFCGAGGLSLGFNQEGFITALANDIEPCCIDTYSHNHPEIPRKYIILGDINEIKENVKELLRFEKIDVLVGGPPCQGFSMANRQRIIDDPRNRLYKSYIEVLNSLQPAFFVMENVKGMLSVAGQVIEDFQRVGYTVSAKILNAKDFGVPQNRERLIFIGNKIGCDNDEIFEKIESKGAAKKTHILADALYGLKPVKASRVKNATYAENDEIGRITDKATGDINEYIYQINCGRKIPVVFNHKARYNNDRDIEIFSRLNPGDKSDDPKIADIMPYAHRNDIFKDKYFKLESDKVCKTITAHMKFDCNMYIHPNQARGLTPREAARVQSYPDDYFFRGSYTKTYMQIGNSVPPMMGKIIAGTIKEKLM